MKAFVQNGAGSWTPYRRVGLGAKVEDTHCHWPIPPHATCHQVTARPPDKDGHSLPSTCDLPSLSTPWPHLPPHKGPCRFHFSWAYFNSQTLNEEGT